MMQRVFVLSAPAAEARRLRNIQVAVKWLREQVLPVRPDITFEELGPLIEKYMADRGQPLNGWWSKTKNWFGDAGGYVSDSIDWLSGTLGDLQGFTSDVSKFFSDLGEMLTGEKRRTIIYALGAAVLLLTFLVLRKSGR